MNSYILQKYTDGWIEKSRRNFSEKEINAVENAVVESSNYGLTVCFFMKSGGRTFIPLSNDATVGLGEYVDLQKAILVTLAKRGENDVIFVSM